MNEDLPETFWAWLAGFIDGDGCIGLYKSKAGYVTLTVNIAQKDPDVLEHIRSTLGVGSVSRRGHTTTANVMHSLAFGTADGRAVLRRVLPYLWVKRQAAEDALAHRLKVGSFRANATAKREEYAAVIEAYQAGESAEQIGARLGLEAATVGYWLRQAGLARPLSEAQHLRRQREMAAPNSKRDEALARYRDGQGARVIARDLGTTVAIVTRWAKEAGVYRDFREAQKIYWEQWRQRR